MMAARRSATTAKSHSEGMSATIGFCTDRARDLKAHFSRANIIKRMNNRPYLIFYDSQCRVCRRGRQLIERLRPRSPVRFVDSNDAGEMARYPQMNARGQMYVLDPTGRLSGGY